MNTTDLALFEKALVTYYQKLKHLQTIDVKHLDGDVISFDVAKMQILSGLYLQPIPNLFHFKPMIEVRLSQIHGRGVFATTDIPIHTMVTFYPADIVEFLTGTTSNNNNLCIYAASKRFQHKFGMNPRLKMLRAYGLGLTDKLIILGCPHFIDDASYLAHMINDACQMQDSNSKDYLDQSNAKSNCQFELLEKNLHVGIRVTKPITKDTELLITYGSDYWSVINKEK